jgi:hypothetical protein
MALSVAGLAIAIGLVLFGWAAFSSGGKESGYPFTADPTNPVDVTVTIEPTYPLAEPTDPATPSASPSPSTSATPTVAAVPATFSVAYRVTSEWGKGFSGEFRITNTSAVAGRWILTATFASAVSISNPSNGVLCSADNTMVAVASRSLGPGQTAVFTFQGGFPPPKKPSTFQPSPLAVAGRTSGCPA